MISGFDSFERSLKIQVVKALMTHRAHDSVMLFLLKEQEELFLEKLKAIDDQSLLAVRDQWIVEFAVNCNRIEEVGLSPNSYLGYLLTVL